MSDYMIYGTVDSRDYGLLLLSDEVAGAVPDYESISVPGRNGDLHRSNNRWFNRERKMVLYCPETAKTSLESFIAALLAEPMYSKISSSIWPAFFMYGTFKGGTEPRKSVAYEAGRVEIIFDCKPQKFLTSGEEEIVINSGEETRYLENPTGFVAKPFLTIQFPSGPSLVEIDFSSASINSVTLLASRFTSVTLDTETMDFIGYDNTNLNPDFSTNHKDIYIPAGTSGVACPDTGTFTLRMKPRWWTL